MKALIKYDDKYFLVKTSDDKTIDYSHMFDMINIDRWPDECVPKEWLIEKGRVLAYFTDESEFAC